MREDGVQAILDTLQEMEGTAEHLSDMVIEVLLECGLSMPDICESLVVMEGDSCNGAVAEFNLLKRKETILD